MGCCRPRPPRLKPRLLRTSHASFNEPTLCPREATPTRHEAPPPVIWPRMSTAYKPRPHGSNHAHSHKPRLHWFSQLFQFVLSHAPLAQATPLIDLPTAPACLKPRPRRASHAPISPDRFTLSPAHSGQTTPPSSHPPVLHWLRTTSISHSNHAPFEELTAIRAPLQAPPPLPRMRSSLAPSGSARPEVTPVRSGAGAGAQDGGGRAQPPVTGSRGAQRLRLRSPPRVRSRTGLCRGGRSWRSWAGGAAGRRRCGVSACWACARSPPSPPVCGASCCTC